MFVVPLFFVYIMAGQWQILPPAWGSGEGAGSETAGSSDHIGPAHDDSSDSGDEISPEAASI